MWRQIAEIRRLSGDEWRVVGQAALLSVFASVAIPALGAERTLLLISRQRRSPRLRQSLPPLIRVARISHAVTTRFGARCLTQSIVLHGLLARRGMPSSVVLGATVESGRFRAHAWVEQDGQVVSLQGPDGCVPVHRLLSANGQVSS